MRKTREKSKIEPIDRIKNFRLDKLSALYSIINEICVDYSRMTDGYSLVTGDKKFENIPEEMRMMINDRQRYYSYKNVIKEIIKEKITNIMENGEDEFEEITS